MEEKNNNDVDLGNDEGAEFNPFDFEDDDADDSAENKNVAEAESETEADSEQPTAASDNKSTKDVTSEQAKPVTTETASRKVEAKEPDMAALADKQPVFEYAGASETIDDVSKTFDELRIEKSSDFPELEDGKRVTWTMEYGKITRTATDPKGMSIGKLKSDIEASKEFADSLKKPRADKNPVCKVKPRVTAQSKGQPLAPSSYKGVFANVEEAETSGKVISIVPAKDGSVYEIRNAEMGRFITPIKGCEMLSEVKAGFIPALPRIPVELTLKVFAFFRQFVTDGDNEALLNVYWDKSNREYIIDAPEQIVTKAAVHSRVNGRFDDERYIHYMDIHSHSTMNAFFSTIDDHDEKATRLYTVVGKLNRFMPEVKTRISNGGTFLEIEPTEVFESIGAAFPKEWAENVRIGGIADGMGKVYEGKEVSE